MNVSHSACAGAARHRTCCTDDTDDIVLLPCPTLGRLIGRRHTRAQRRLAGEARVILAADAALGLWTRIGERRLEVLACSRQVRCRRLTSRPDRRLVAGRAGRRHAQLRRTRLAQRRAGIAHAGSRSLRVPEWCDVLRRGLGGILRLPSVHQRKSEAQRWPRAKTHTRRVERRLRRGERADLRSRRGGQLCSRGVRLASESRPGTEVLPKLRLVLRLWRDDTDVSGRTRQPPAPFAMPTLSRAYSLFAVRRESPSSCRLRRSTLASVPRRQRR